MRKIIRYSILTALVLCCLPAKMQGQYVMRDKIEGIKQIKNIVAIYAEGLYPGAIWNIGTNLSDVKHNTNATIRHTESKGNGSNLNANSKVPFRFLVAPTDANNGQGSTWAEAMGFDAANNSNANEQPSGTLKNTGCAGYKAQLVTSGADYGEFAKINNWRLPTQRELQLMYVLNTGLNWAFYQTFNKNTQHYKAAMLTGNYWCATELDGTRAWYFNFDTNTCNITAKNGSGGKLKVRCVSDY